MPKWEDIREDLFEAIIQVHPPINKEQQVEIVAAMRARGHDMGWNAIRYVAQYSAVVVVLVLARRHRPSECGKAGSIPANISS
jgi:hypothetical protein